MKSIMLLFLSYPMGVNKFNNYISRPTETYSFEYDNDELLYTGRVTNDAPVKCLFDIAKKNGDKIEKVLCISSSLVEGRDEEGEFFELEYDYFLLGTL